MWEKVMIMLIMDSYAKMKQKRVLLYLLLSFVFNCIPPA